MDQMTVEKTRIALMALADHTRNICNIAEESQKVDHMVFNWNQRQKGLDIAKQREVANFIENMVNNDVPYSFFQPILYGSKNVSEPTQIEIDKYTFS